MNIANLTKAEIVKRANYRCKHHHTGLSHPQCYDTETGAEKIGFLDIEASNLKANFGIVLSYCIKELDGPVIKRLITPEDLKSGDFDKHLMEKFCNEDAKKFTRLVTFYGSRFDIPFLRTRSLLWKQNFPVYKAIKHSDIYMMARGKLCLHSKRLAVISHFFGIEAKEHPIVPDVWLKCLSGNKKALNYILTHNEEDVVSLEKVWKLMEPYVRITGTSI